MSVAQIGGDGAKPWSDHAAEDFALSGLLHPSSACSAAGLGMAEQGYWRCPSTRSS